MATEWVWVAIIVAAVAGARLIASQRGSAMRATGQTMRPSTSPPPSLEELQTLRAQRPLTADEWLGVSEALRQRGELDQADAAHLRAVQLAQAQVTTDLLARSGRLPPFVRVHGEVSNVAFGVFIGGVLLAICAAVLGAMGGLLTLAAGAAALQGH